MKGLRSPIYRCGLFLEWPLSTEAISIRKGLSLYKQPQRNGGGSPYWYARVYMPIAGKSLHVKSTRTTDIREATMRAEDLLGQCLMLKLGGPTATVIASDTPRPSARFDRVADDWLHRKEVEAGSDERQLRAYSDAKKLCLAPNGLCAFFRRTDVSSITTDMVRDYLAFAVERSTKGELAPTTKRNHISALNGILKFAHEKRLISGVPSMPKIRLKDNPRPWFTAEEFRLLCRSAAFLSDRAMLDGDGAASARWQETHDFLVFMVSTFLRPSEWKHLRQKHVQFVEGDHPHLKIAVFYGKTGQRSVVSMPDAIDVYRRIRSRDGIDPERYLFKPLYRNRTTAYERMRDCFEELLRETGFAFDAFGKKRVIYSLRHTSLMLRLLEGDNVPLLMLARNAGTSIDQLERFYLSHIQAEMTVANLHSLKPSPQPKRLTRPTQKAVAINIRRGISEPAAPKP